MIRVRISPDPIDAATEQAWLEAGPAGAVASFTGLVRVDDGVTALSLEHYPGVADRVLAELATAAVTRWSLDRAVIVHRVGAMRPGERIVFAGAAARHRGAALDACAYLIDRLKTDAPFWKRETLTSGSRWVEPRAVDADTAGRWDRG